MTTFLGWKYHKSSYIQRCLMNLSLCNLIISRKNTCKMLIKKNLKRQKNVGCGKAHFTSNWKCCLRLNLISSLHPSWIANFMSQQIMRAHFTSKQSLHFVKTDFDKLPNEDSKYLTWNRAHPVPSVRDIPRTIPGAAKRRGRAAKQRGLKDSVKWVDDGSVRASRSPPVTFYRTFAPNLWQIMLLMYAIDLLSN